MLTHRRPASLLAAAGLMVAGSAPLLHAKELLLRRYVPIEVYANFNPGVTAHPPSTRYRYMDAEDTFIAASHPDANYGRAETLRITDPRDRILLAFRLLYRAIEPDHEITDVELLLAPAGEVDRNVTIQVHRVTLPWRDGGSDGAYQQCAATYRERFAGQGPLSRPWTTPGGATDRRAEPSFTGRLGDCWDDARQAFVLSSAGLIADVREWHKRHYRNYGWMISVAPDTALARPLAFHASDVLEEAHRPALRVAFGPPAKQVLKPKQRPDLDVTHIERVPRYTRYNDNGRTSYTRREFRGDMPGIMNDPDYDQYQKHPQPGELVTFIAHVKNASDQPYHGPLTYRWKINDRVVKEKTADGGSHELGRALPATTVDLGPWEELTTRLTWEWNVDLADHRKVVLEFEVDPDDVVNELSEHNNALTKYVAGRTLKYWVEKSVYEYVKKYVTCWGSRSFEDYLQWHFDVWNETYFDKSRFDDVAPDGCVVRTTLDAFEIVPDGFLAGGIHRAEDELDPRFDGEWGTEWVPFDTEEAAQHKNFYDFLQRHRVVLEPSLLHEASHQTWGAYDIYWSNIEASTPTDPVGKCKVKDESGHYIPRGHWYIYGGLMGGSDTRPNPDYWDGTDLYSVQSVIGANANARFRNGFYGEWQYDLPEECFVRLTSRDGVPLDGAEITLWQQTWKGILNENRVAEDVAADSDGVVPLPNQDSLAPVDYTVITGHTLRKRNPWGRIDVVGQNVTMLVQVDAHGQRDWHFVRVLPFNRAYAAGATQRYTLPLNCRISPAALDFERNVAAGATASASRAPEQAGLLVDGDVATSWQGGRCEAGDYLEIVLPRVERVGALRIVQDAAHGEFFQRFEIRVREHAPEGGRDGAEAGGPWTRFDAQGPEPFRSAMANDKDVNPERSSERWVTYVHAPLPARVIRVEALDGGPALVSEIRVYAEQP